MASSDASIAVISPVFIEVIRIISAALALAQSSIIDAL
jgi:hypothetical protein